jgi:hypothetical protein
MQIHCGNIPEQGMIFEQTKQINFRHVISHVISPASLTEIKCRSRENTDYPPRELETKSKWREHMDE